MVIKKSLISYASLPNQEQLAIHYSLHLFFRYHTLKLYVYFSWIALKLSKMSTLYHEHHENMKDDYRLLESEGTKEAEQTTIDTYFSNLKQLPPFHWHKNGLIFVIKYYILFQCQFVLIIFYSEIKAKCDSQCSLKKNSILY